MCIRDSLFLLPCIRKELPVVSPVDTKYVRYIATCRNYYVSVSYTHLGGEDTREELFLAFSHADVPMLTLNQSKTTLEEIFLELTQGSGNRMIKEEK